MKSRYIFALMIVSVFILSMSINPVQSAIPNDEFIYITQEGEPDSVDPAVTYETRGGGIQEQVYDTLLTYDGASTTLVPSLAKEMPTVSADAKTITYKLREDVDFTDGVHFDAYVMKYSIDRAVLMDDPDGPVWMISQAIAGAGDYSGGSYNASAVQAYFDAGGVEVVDQYTIKFNLDLAYIPFLAAMTYGVGNAVSPKAVIDNQPADWASNSSHVKLSQFFPDSAKRPSWFDDYPDSVGAGILPGEHRHAWMDEHAVGTGPYKLVEIRTGEGIEYVRNDDWWKSKAGLADKPQFKKVFSNAVGESSTRILAMKNEEADGALIAPANMDEVFNLDTEEVLIDGLRVDLAKTFTVRYFGFQMNESNPRITEAATSTYDSSLWEKWGTGNPSFGDKAGSNPISALKFREALSLAFDYNAFMDVAVNGYGQRMVGVIPDGLLGHQPNLEVPDTNAAAAKTLFEEVGWQGTIKVTYNAGNELRQASSELLRDNVNALGVGITLEVEELEWSTMLDDMRAEKLAIWLIGWAPDYADPDNYAAPFLDSSGTLSKRQNYLNTAVDAKIASAAVETNEAARIQLYKEIEELALADLPIMYLYQGLRAIVSQDYVKGITGGFTLNPMASSRYAYSEITKEGGGGVPGFTYLFALTGLMIAALVYNRRKH